MRDEYGWSLVSVVLFLGPRASLSASALSTQNPDLPSPLT